MTDQQLQKHIEKYIKGELIRTEINKLWIEFLKDPEWYRVFDTYLHLRNLVNNA